MTSLPAPPTAIEESGEAGSKPTPAAMIYNNLKEKLKCCGDCWRFSFVGYAPPVSCEYGLGWMKELIKNYNLLYFACVFSILSFFTFLLVHFVYVEG